MTNAREDNWWINAVVYEMYVDKFAGDFKGLVQKLDYLTYLGVNTLWLLPYYPSPMVDGGYDITDHTSVRSELGNIADFDDFLSKAHANNFKVIIDLVLNHTSDTHPWFVEARSSKTNPKRNFYMWSKTGTKYGEAYVHKFQGKTSNWIKNGPTSDYYYATFYPQQPDLNWDNKEVYDAMLGVMQFWLDKGVDGFRLDAVSRLIKREGTNCFALPETHEILKKLKNDIDSKYDNILLLAESGGWPNEAKTFFGDGDECQSVINFPLAANTLAAIPDQDATVVDNVWQESNPIPDNCRWATFLTNHDSVDLFFITNEANRVRLANNYGLYSNYGDTNGPSFAARLAEICGGDKASILWAFNKQFALPAIPIIYYGNEIGMTNIQLPEKPEDFREYVRGVFDWQKAEEQMKDPDSLLNSVRKLIINR